MFSESVENIISIQKKRDNRTNETKKIIYNKLKDKINNYAQLGINKFIYEVPSFLFGHSIYNISDMTKYIFKKLKDEGFYVIKISNNYIFISWDIKDLNK